jgi:hypothetical protein
MGANLAQSVQESSPALDEGASRAVQAFESDFFTQFNAQTALDMVERIPGFVIEGIASQRGLAEGFGNVLINGAPPAGKADLFQVLEQIPARDVERIELIRESVEGLDLRGRTRVVNVVLSRSSGVSGTWLSGLDAVAEGQLLPYLGGSMTRALFGGEMTLGLQLNSWARPRYEIDTRRTPAGDLLREEVSTGRNYSRVAAPSLRFTRRFEGGHEFQLDARGQIQVSGRERFRAREDGLGAPLSFEVNTGDGAAWSSDVSAEYTFQREGGATLTFTGVQESSYEEDEQAFLAFDALGLADGARFIVADEATSETIVRSQYARALNSRHDIELAVEAAYNRLEGDFALFEDQGLGRIEIPVPGGDTTVDELRFNVSGLYAWRPVEGLVVETRLGWETSEIRQSGDFSNARRLSFLKPGVTATWTPSEQVQWRLSAQRRVGQLNFGDFVASVNLRDEQQDDSNPELEPERIFELEAEYERRLGDRGSFNATLGHEWIEALPGIVPLNGRDAPGNLEEGRVLRLELEASLPLERFGVSGGLLESSIIVRDTSVEDPVTLERRSIDFREPWQASLNFRQDLSERQLSWGVNYHLRAEEFSRRLREQSRFTPRRGDVFVFIETSRFKGFTLEAGLELFLDPEDEQTREFFAPDRTGDLVRVDTRTREFFDRIYVQFSGTF